MMKTRWTTTARLTLALTLAGCGVQDQESPDASPVQDGDFEKSVTEYFKTFPYQDTFNYATNYTEGDPAKFNTWVLGAEPVMCQNSDQRRGPSLIRV